MNSCSKKVRAKKNLKTGEDLKPYSPDERDLATKLYAVLTSYLRGRCVGLVVSFASSKIGFRFWRALVTECEPPSRRRSLMLRGPSSRTPSVDCDRRYNLQSVQRNHSQL